MALIANKLKSAVGRAEQTLQRYGELSSIALGNYNLLLIAEGTGWILDDFSKSLLRHLPHKWRGRATYVIPHQVKNKTLHFVERYRFLRMDDPAPLAHQNHVILTWWHGGVSEVQHVHLDELLGRVPEVAQLPILFHITSSLYREPLLELGVPAERIAYCPMGVDLQRFALRESRSDHRARLGIPEGKICIGYFQRDGDEQPKLVKGPDVFIQVIRQLWSQRDDLFVLLAGPKRGYVMRNLDQIGVPYHYVGWVPPTEMARYYFASDLYLITSREEGGPAAVLECMATGTPLVSTRVGMAVDVVQGGQNGFLVEIEDVQGIADCALALIRDPSLRERVMEQALATAPRYDWSVIAPGYAELYVPRQPA